MPQDTNQPVSGSRQGGDSSAGREDAISHHADALAAMAQGQDITPTDEHELRAGIDAGNQADSAEMFRARNSANESAAGVAFEPQPDKASNRAVRARQAGLGSGGSLHHQFQVIMVPLLLAVGVVLIVMGTASLGLMIGQDNVPTFQKVVTFASFPVALVLLGGAMLFRREIRSRRASSDDKVDSQKE